MYHICFVDKQGKKWWLVDLPSDDKPLSGIGFRGDSEHAGTCPTVEDAEKVIDWLKESCYGEPDAYFHELVN